MKQFDNDSYKKEINKTETMVKGLFYSSFNKINDERLDNELEIKITKWKKNLEEFINENNPYTNNKTELDIASDKLKNKKIEITKEDILNDLNNFGTLSDDINTDFWKDKINSNYDLNIIKNNIV